MIYQARRIHFQDFHCGSRADQPPSLPVWAFVRHTLRHLGSRGLLMTLGLILILPMAACSDVVVVKSKARLEIAPTVLQFPPTRVGESSTLTFTVFEVSDQSSTTLRSFSFAGADAAAFSVEAFAELEVPRGGAVELTVRFTPLALGSATAEGVLVADNLQGEPPLLQLLGTALGADVDGDGLSEDEGDCDDSSADNSPDSPELCDGVDNDCNGEIDDQASDMATWYLDMDQDGAAGSDAVLACDAPEGAQTLQSDCNDANAQIHPGALEVCDDVDQDCNGLIDDNPSDPETFYVDADGDGHGDASRSTAACAMPQGHTSSHDDCDDTRSAVYPGAPELCNSQDDDCDGLLDEDVANPPAWYADEDGDGYGLDSDVLRQCTAPGRVSVAGDCDDTDAARHPAAAEICNDIDDNCNAQIDDGLATQAWYPDADGDTFGASNPKIQDCAQPAGHVLSNGDCDDARAEIHPGAVEVCDDIDQDCDGAADDGLATQRQYPDGDVDGYGNSSLPQDSCRTLEGFVARGGDCNDTLATVYPGAQETCNRVDDDCDAQIDEGAVDAALYYRDADTDSFGGTSTVLSCAIPTGYVALSGDCNDADATIYPGADEYCNALDDDCDAQIDEDAVDAILWGTDSDGDGFGDEPLTSSCEGAPDQVVVDETHPSDCDDSDADYHPGATESCDGEDYNCDNDWAPKSCDGCHVGKNATTSLYRTIQEALNLAAAGEDFGGEVRVCSGTYTENLRFYGAPVIVRALDPANTILDGSTCAKGQALCSAVSFRDGEGAASGLSGFVIKGGKGTARSQVVSGGGSETLGGGILAFKSSPTLTDLTISGGQASSGSGIYLQEGALTLARMTLSGQGQALNGGGIYATDASLSASNLTIRGQLTNLNGAGLYLNRVNSALLSEVRLEDNVAAQNGGALFAMDSDLILSSLHVEGNSANAQNGGGIVAERGGFVLIGSSFLQNTVAGGTDVQGGGALHIKGIAGVLISASTFVDNSSHGNGGAVMLVDAPNAQLSTVSFEGNSAASYGGAVALSGTGADMPVLIEEADFIGNDARFGAGVWSKSARPTLRHLTFFQNISGEFGASLYSQSSQLDVRNSLFLNNQARQAAGIYVSSSTGNLINNTFEQNVARERASSLVVTGSGVPSIQGNIFSRGSDTNGDLGVEGPSSLGSTFRYNDVFENGVSGFASDSTNLALDPMFKSTTASSDLSTWDLSFKPASPCKNVGNPDSSYNDVDGTRNDLGAYGGPGGAW